MLKSRAPVLIYTVRRLHYSFPVYQLVARWDRGSQSCTIFLYPEYFFIKQKKRKGLRRIMLQLGRVRVARATVISVQNDGTISTASKNGPQDSQDLAPPVRYQPPGKFAGGKSEVGQSEERGDRGE